MNPAPSEQVGRASLRSDAARSRPLGGAGTPAVPVRGPHTAALRQGRVPPRPDLGGPAMTAIDRHPVSTIPLVYRGWTRSHASEGTSRTEQQHFIQDRTISEAGVRGPQIRPAVYEPPPSAVDHRDSGELRPESDRRRPAQRSGRFRSGAADPAADRRGTRSSAPRGAAQESPDTLRCVLRPGCDCQGDAGPPDLAAPAAAACGGGGGRRDLPDGRWQSCAGRSDRSRQPAAVALHRVPLPLSLRDQNCQGPVPVVLLSGVATLLNRAGQAVLVSDGS
jgi:hypothetical protein